MLFFYILSRILGATPRAHCIALPRNSYKEIRGEAILCMNSIGGLTPSC